MKIIDVGICVNNIDPKGIGRIRFRPYGVYTSELENHVQYDEWDELDPFIAAPFLPLHINVIPQVQQAVKLIEYDTENEFQNVEYISGPFTSPHDMQNQTFATQHKGTTYGGVIVKGIKDIRTNKGIFNNSASRGTIINERDTGLRGNYGSDIIFSENGVQLRGGFLLSKEGKNKKSLLEYPQLAKKMGRLNLKKFPTTYQAIKETIETSEVTSSRLNYIVEYEINNLSTPTELRIFVYKVTAGQGFAKRFDTNTFNENSDFDPTDKLQVRLINTTNTLTDPSYVVPINESIESAYIELRELLNLIDTNNLTVLDLMYPNEDIHPFYFRPSSAFRLLRGTSSTEITNKTNFINKVQLRNRTNGFGLIYSRQAANAPLITGKKEVITAKEIPNSGEQSFGSIIADKVFITSTSPNIGVNIKSINFNDLNEYELTQEDYVAIIEPNTYAMVRGDILYQLLVAIKKFLDGHRHNINDPPAKDGDQNYVEYDRLMQTLEDDLLNRSLRIN